MKSRWWKLQYIWTRGPQWNISFIVCICNVTPYFTTIQICCFEAVYIGAYFGTTTMMTNYPKILDILTSIFLNINHIICVQISLFPIPSPFIFGLYSYFLSCLSVLHQPRTQLLGQLVKQQKQRRLITTPEVCKNAYIQTRNSYIFGLPMIGSNGPPVRSNAGKGGQVAQLEKTFGQIRPEYNPSEDTRKGMRHETFPAEANNNTMAPPHRPNPAKGKTNVRVLAFF